jgi:DNA primase
LFALDRAKKPILREKAALLCEGQLDVISCHELGIDHAIAPLGTAFTREHAKLLRRYTNHVLVCYDSDKAGVAASERLFRELAPEGLSMRVVCMPSGDDPDTYLKSHGAETFRRLLGNAKEFFDFKLEYARAQGALDTAAGRTAVLTECADILALMGDVASRENQLNSVVTHLQTSSMALRQEIARIKSRPQRRPRERTEPGEEKSPTEPTPIHQIVAFMCHLALTSGPAQHFLGEQFETLHEASHWLEGVSLLESILVAAPNPEVPSSIQSFFLELEEADRIALNNAHVMYSKPWEGLPDVESALALLSSTVLQKRDAAVKAALKEPGLPPGRMIELLEEAKEISGLLRGIGQRSEFDDELPASTWKPKVPEWRSKWRERA